MTDYHSPWRFPPVVPYTEDPDAPSEDSEPQAVAPNAFRPVSWEVKPIKSAGRDMQMSERFERMYR